jgi:uncharacterized protein
MGFALVFLVAIASGAAAASPSFDCGKAQGEIEQLICGDEGLAGCEIKR